MRIAVHLLHAESTASTTITPRDAIFAKREIMASLRELTVIKARGMIYADIRLAISRLGLGGLTQERRASHQHCERRQLEL
jgi:hypothetical protein